MNKVLISESAEARTAISKLFDNNPPVLIEVRFPGMATSPDWYLCEEKEEMEQILAKVAPGVELYLSSVWDLKNTKGELCLKKQS